MALRVEFRAAGRQFGGSVGVGDEPDESVLGQAGAIGRDTVDTVGLTYRDCPGGSASGEQEESAEKHDAYIGFFFWIA